MPTTRRKKATRRGGVLLQGHQYFLQFGFYLDGDEEFTSEKQKKETWVRYQKQIVAHHIENWPGTRPWAWWVFGKKAEMPPLGEQPELLRQMNELSETEIETLGKWDLCRRSGGGDDFLI